MSIQVLGGSFSKKYLLRKIFTYFHSISTRAASFQIEPHFIPTDGFNVIIFAHFDCSLVDKIGIRFVVKEDFTGSHFLERPALDDFVCAFQRLYIVVMSACPSIGLVFLDNINRPFQTLGDVAHHVFVYLCLEPFCKEHCLITELESLVALRLERFGGVIGNDDLVIVKVDLRISRNRHPHTAPKRAEFGFVDAHLVDQHRLF